MQASECLFFKLVSLRKFGRGRRIKHAANKKMSRQGEKQGGVGQACVCVCVREGESSSGSSSVSDIYF